MPDAPATLQSSAEYALPSMSRDSPDTDFDIIRRSQLERASRVYATILRILAPGPDVAAALMREQFEEQVRNPERYHRIDEVENDQGMRIGDAIIRLDRPGRTFTITSICAHQAGGQRRVEVHAIAPDSYGGWAPLDSVQPAPDTLPAPHSELLPGPSYQSVSQKRVAKAINSRGTKNESDANDDEKFQARQNSAAVAAAVKWGFDAGVLIPNQDGWVTPKFERIEFAVQLTAPGANAEITVAQAPNGMWASAAAYCETRASHLSKPFPNGGYRQHSSRDAAIREQLEFLRSRISKNLFVQVEQVAGLPCIANEGTISPSPATRRHAPDPVQVAPAPAARAVENDAAPTVYAWSEPNRSVVRTKNAQGKATVLPDEERARANAKSSSAFCGEVFRTASGDFENLKMSPRMDLAALTRTASSIQAAWPGVPPFVCVATPEDLPFPAPPTTRGAFHRDTIYLVASNIIDKKDLQFVIGHEAIGHAGLRAVLDDDSLDREMDRLRRINPDLDRAAREKVTLHGYSLNLSTEEALCDMAGRGVEIHGLQPLMLALQRGLRRVGLGAFANWLESKSHSETMALLRRAKLAITKCDRYPVTFGTPSGALSARQTTGANMATRGQALVETVAHLIGKAGAPLPNLNRPTGERVSNRRLDQFGLRAFGLTSINQVHPAYRDIDTWRPIPAIMTDQKAVGAIRTELYRIEANEIQCGMFNLNANGNIIIFKWNPVDTLQPSLSLITALADRHGLGVLITKSAFASSIESERALRHNGFCMAGPSVTRVATGRHGPSNYITFTRRPAGAILFSHATIDAHDSSTEKKLDEPAPNTPALATAVNAQLNVRIARTLSTNGRRVLGPKA